MNCESCNATIDYRFLTNCPHCDGEVQRATLTQIDPNAGSVARSLTWKQSLINVVYVLTSSLAGMISGAAVTYLFVAIIYNVFLTHSNNPSVECARGAALGLLALISGALLGTAGASTFAVTHPLCKGGAKYGCKSYDRPAILRTDSTTRYQL